MANQQADQETIADKLYQIERERMGLFGNMENCKAVAKKIIDIRNSDNQTSF